MKTKLTLLFIISCSAFAARATDQTWITPYPQANDPHTGANIGVTTNWSPANIPMGGNTGVFDATVPGDLVVYSEDGVNHTGSPIGSFVADGFHFHITSGHTGAWTLNSAVPSSTVMGFSTFQVDAGAGQVTFGDNTANQLVCTLRPAGSVHGWTNNSSFPVIINPNFQLNNGGGVAGHVMDLVGTGDWNITNNLRNNNFAPAMNLQLDISGTMNWTAGGVNDKFNGGLGTVTINSGTMIVHSAGLFPELNLITNNATLLKFDAVGANDTIIRTICGTGPLEVANGTWTFTGANTYTGNTIVSGGTLVITTAGGNVNVEGGTLVPAPVGTVGALTVAGNLNMDAGTVLMALNKSLSPSNSVITVGSGVNYTGGTLKLVNYGPALVAGDTFTLFNLPATGGAGVTIVSPGFTVVNNLVSNGSVTVATVLPAPAITATPSGGNENLTWPAGWTGAHLQVQTNSLAAGLQRNWVTIPGSDASNSYVVTLDNLNETVFYRLAP